MTAPFMYCAAEEPTMVVVWHPRWKGCRTQGATLDEAVATLREVYPKFLRAMQDLGVPMFTEDTR